MNQASLLRKAALSFGEQPAVTAGLNSLYNYQQISNRAARLGGNIYPREVEEVLLRHDDISECSVVDRQHADWGEEVIAFIISAKGTEIGKEKLDALRLDHIARFKRPKEYRFIAALPKNNYGKVLKTELRSLLAAEKESG